MIFMADTSHDLRKVSEELGCEVEQLFTPLNGFKPQEPEAHFALDNGAYSGFDAKAFRKLLARHEERRKLCRFLAVPDVVGSAIRTGEVFEHWSQRLINWPLAFVAQDGQEKHPIPWTRIAAVFIGGSTEFKTGPHARAVIRAGQAVGAWVHVGRVNTPGRFEYFEDLGVDSIDGTGLSLYSHMREKVNHRRMTPTLFEEKASA